MKIIWNPLHEFIIKESQNNAPLLLISPFIKLNALKSIINSMKTTNSLQVIVRWNENDIIQGVSDLSIYDFLKSKNIPLYINKKIHLKLIVFNSNEGFHTSGNITSKGLGFTQNYNEEIGCKVSLSKQDWEEIYRIADESILVNDYVYGKYLEFFTNHQQVDKNDFNPINLDDLVNKEFLISSLPIVNTPDLLFKFYNNIDTSSINPEDLRKAVHDLKLYNIANNSLEEIEFFKTLSKEFLNHSFIKSIILVVKQKESIRFGEMNSIIQAICADVPTPYKWEIKENTHILYNWLAFFCKQISWSVPGKRSQVIFWNKKIE